MKLKSKFGEPKWAHRRITHRGLHGIVHIDKERRIALLMIVTGMIRVFGWTALTVAYWVHMKFAADLFNTVQFVALISVFALIETAWGQVAASLAQYTAAHGHHDIEQVRNSMSVDTTAIIQDLEKLAKLKPGKEGDKLAKEISIQIAGMKI